MGVKPARPIPALFVEIMRNQLEAAEILARGRARGLSMLDCQRYRALKDEMRRLRTAAEAALSPNNGRRGNAA